MNVPNTDPPILVLLLDDRSVIREAATALLEPHGFHVDAVESPGAFENNLGRQNYAIAMLDYLLQSDPTKRRTDNTPSGLSLVPMVRERQPGCRIVIFSDLLEQEMVRRAAYEFGVDGMISKGDTWRGVAHGLRQVLDPGVVEYVSPSLRQRRGREPTGIGALTPAEMNFVVKFVRRPGTRAEVIRDQALTPGNFDALINSIKRKANDQMLLAGDPRATDSRLVSNEVLLQWAMERGVE